MALCTVLSTAFSVDMGGDGKVRLFTNGLGLEGTQRIILLPAEVAHRGDSLGARGHQAGLLHKCRTDAHREAHVAEV